jgi:energy-coupling factor transporter ATP-binding protein EcfA2
LQDVVLPGVECWIAFLLEQGHIEVAEVLVYTRAFDDAIDAVLMRSKAEAELARLKSDAHRLALLHAALAASSVRPDGMPELRATISLSPTTDAVSASSSSGAGSAPATRDFLLEGIGYTRGAASVAIDQVRLSVPGFYAVAGPNGVGKSSLFALIGACHEALEAWAASNDAAVEAVPTVVRLPAGLNLTRGDGHVALPAGRGGKRPHVVEIGQRAYTPLHVRPIEWLTSEDLSHDAASAAARIAALAAELRLGLGEASGEAVSGDGSGEGSSEGRVDPHAEEPGSAGHAKKSTAAECLREPPFISSLFREHEDWGAAMSGGQRIKLELIRSIFLREACPEVLLLDEALAPLDPWSKQYIMRRLRSFCSESLVLVIYHADAREEDTGEVEVGVDDTGASKDEDSVVTENVSSSSRGSALADVCGAGGGSFFDGMMHFADDGKVTFDAVLDRCP